MICPNCNKEIPEDSKLCTYCEFDIALFNEAFQRIYDEKLYRLNHPQEHNNTNTSYYSVPLKKGNESVHKPRCPFCNSEDLTKITNFDRAINAAMFGLLGNKRKYQWHCNHCKTNW